MLIKQLINFFVGKCGGYEIFFVILQRVLQLTIHKSQFTKGYKSMYGLGILGEKVEAFTKRVVKATKYIKEHKEYSLADQFFRSGTSIGANCSEAVSAVSKADFANKLSIALKEANETCHWIEVVYAAELIDQKAYESVKNDAVEICKLLTTIIKNTRTNIENEKKNS
jgi:four helix bundle protein